MRELQIDKVVVVGRDIFVKGQVPPVIHASNVQFTSDINSQVQQLHE